MTHIGIDGVRAFFGVAARTAERALSLSFVWRFCGGHLSVEVC